MPDHIQLLLLLLFAGFYLLAALHLIDYLCIMWKEMRKNERLQRGRPAESCLRHRIASRG